MLGEGGDEEVAEAVALEVALVEAVLEELGEEVLVLRERDHAVADVAGRQHVEVFAETAGGATVVGDGDDGGEVADEAGKVRGGGLGATVGPDGAGRPGRGRLGLGPEAPGWGESVARREAAVAGT